MVRFRLNKRFDVICCVIFLINHVLRFPMGRTLFSHAERHLVEDGCFIFDINTQRKLIATSENQPGLHPFGKISFIMKVTEPPKAYIQRRIKVFE